MKIILFCGTFDPIHKGHINIALSAIKKINADKLIFIPTFKSPVNKNYRTSFDHRCNMIKLIISKYNKLFLSRIEKQFNCINYTYKTIQYFKNKYPKHEFYLLMGEDQYINLNKWTNYEYIINNVKVIVANRNKNIKLNNNIIYVKNNIICSSSDLIINPDKKYLDNKIINYINNNGLYWLERLNKYNLSEYRMQHSINVANLAYKIAKKNNIKNPFDAWIAGIYHDIAKELNKDECELYIKNNLSYIKNYPSWKVLHAYIGADILEKIFYFKNKNIISSIYNHTIIKDERTLNKIIYCADKLVYRDDDTNYYRNKIIKIRRECFKDYKKGYTQLIKLLRSMYE